MSGEMKVAFVAVLFLGFLFLGLFLGTAWEQALRHDCNLAAMETRVYDSAQIRQICGK